MVLLAPTLSRALDVAERFANGKGSAAEVLESLPAALEFANEGVKLYRLLAPGLLRNESINELLRQIELEHQAQIDGFQNLIKAAQANRHLGLKGTVKSVRTACERLLGLFSQLEQEERQGGSASAFPLVDALIKTSYNCLQGQVDASELKPRVDGSAALLNTLRNDVLRFQLLYVSDAAEAVTECVASTGPSFQLVEAGLGAAHSYLQSLKKVELEDCIRLLLQASTPLHQALQRMDKIAEEHVRFTPMRYLEELGRAIELPRAGQEWLVDQTRARVEQVLEHYGREFETVAGSAIHFEVQDELDFVFQHLTEAKAAFAAWAPAPGPILPLIPSFQALEESYAMLRHCLSEEVSRYSQAAHLAELRDLIGRTLLGQLSPAGLGEGLDQARERHQEFLQHLQGGAATPALAELEDLIRKHGPALDMMYQFLDEPNPDYLANGWKQISNTVPRILEINQQLRAEAVARPGAAKSAEISCPRCGQNNARGSKFCSKCKGQLPQVTEEVVEYTDIAGGSGPAQQSNTPANLTKLATIAAKAGMGAMSRDEVLEAMDGMLNESDIVARQFQNQVISQMGRDPQFDELVELFATSMQHYIDGMMLMRSYGEGASISDLQAGVDACFEAGNHLVEMKDQIAEVIKTRRQ